MNKHLESASRNSTTPDGFAIVADLISRQDVVLTELDALNDQIEAVILQITSLRQADVHAELAEASDDCSTLKESDSETSSSTFSQSPIIRAA